MNVDARNIGYFSHYNVLSLVLQRTVRRLLAEGRSGSYEKAELAAQLLNFNFDEADSVQAAEECSSIYTAIQFLQQDCELCAERYPMRKVCRGFVGHLDVLFILKTKRRMIVAAAALVE